MSAATGRYVVAAAVASLALVGAYAAFGGLSYHPTPVADPCDSRPAPSGSGLDDVVQRVVLEGADAAACALGVSREDLVLALRSTDDLKQLAEDAGLDADRIEQAVRDGIDKAVAVANDEGVLSDSVASTLRGAVNRLPFGFVLDLLRNASDILGSSA